MKPKNMIFFFTKKKLKKIASFVLKALIYWRAESEVEELEHVGEHLAAVGHVEQHEGHAHHRVHHRHQLAQGGAGGHLAVP